MLNAIFFQRIAHWLHEHSIPFLPKLLKALIFFMYNSILDPSTEIGNGTRLAYGGIGVVIHSRCRIGKNVLISQGVTLGGRSRSADVPVVEDDVYIGAGAKILGAIRLGKGCVVGANAVVLHDVPAHAIVAGVPAKILREGVNRNDYV